MAKNARNHLLDRIEPRLGDIPIKVFRGWVDALEAEARDRGLSAFRRWVGRRHYQDGLFRSDVFQEIAIYRAEVKARRAARRKRGN